MKYLYTFLLLLTANLLFSQSAIEKESSKLGITFSPFGESAIVRFTALDGEASNEGDGFFNIGVNYLHHFNQNFALETGFEYSKHTLIINQNSPIGSNIPSLTENVSLINLPVSIRAIFLKHLFVNSGMLIDIDVSKSNAFDNQNGIGGLIGFGATYDFDFGMSIFVNPYIKAHSLISFSSESNPQRLIESGIRTGLVFRLN